MNLSEKKTKTTLMVIAGALVLVLTGVSLAFFNYTRTGEANLLRVGNINFLSSYDEVTMTNLFPTTAENATDEVEVSIQGSTSYADGIEYKVTFSDVTNTINNKRVPINFVASSKVENGEDTLGTSSNDYFNDRGGNTTIYNLTSTGEITNNKEVLKGFITKDDEMDGTLVIKAYLDSSKIAISDTLEDGDIAIPNTTNGTTSTWVDGRVVLTTEEWNSLQSGGLSFKIKVEANEGTWIKNLTSAENLAAKVISRLGQDGVVAVNTDGDLYSGSGTIREYRYSGIGNYCTYTDGTNDYNISVEGTTCPEHAYRGEDGHIFIGSSDAYTLWGTYDEIELNRVNTTPTDSGLKNYVRFNNEMWRIVGVFGDKVKIMKDLPLLSNVTTNETDTDTYNDANELYTNTLNEKYHLKYLAFDQTPKYGYFVYNGPQDRSNYTYKLNNWTHSGLMYYLNEENTGSYYNTIGASYKNLIDTTTYYLGNVSINNSTYMADGTAKQIYEQERGNIECDGNVTEWSQNASCNIWNGNSATWSGKVGLLYPSDYAYASSSSHWTSNLGEYYSNGGSLNNWMFNTDAFFSWLLSPASSGANYALFWYYVGYVESYYVLFGSSYGALRPVLNLVSTVATIEGDGSYNNPYILNIE